MKTIYWVFSCGDIRRLEITAETNLSFVGLSESGEEYLFAKSKEGQFWHLTIEGAQKEADQIFEDKKIKNSLMETA